MEKLLKLLKEIRPDVDFDTEKSLVGAGVLDSGKTFLIRNAPRYSFH